MKRKSWSRLPMIGLAVLASLVAANQACRAQESAAAVGIFEGHGDVGTVLHAGASEYDAAGHSYTLTGSGENMWFNSDDFQFAWKKLSGDVALTADISFAGKGGNAHRKAVLMLRQSSGCGFRVCGCGAAWRWADFLAVP